MTENAPLCELLYQCSDKCSPPAPCGNTAEARVSVSCSSPGCDHATQVLVLCAFCAVQTAILAGRPVTMRALEVAK